MTTQRERFEAMATAPDRQWSVERQAHNGVEPGAYRAVATQAAWLAWQEAERRMKERCADVCESQATHTDVRNPERVEYDPASTMAKKCASLIRALEADDAVKPTMP